MHQLEEAIPSGETVEPAWFRSALSKSPVSAFVQVDGVPVHYLAWNAGDRDKPPLVFVHGFRAHAHWWDFIAPSFIDDYRVFALDFSGMGDSGHRESYGPMTFADDLLGLIDQVDLAQVTVVAHSFGGGRVLRACAEVPGRIQHAVIIDSYVQFHSEAVSAVPTPRRDAAPTATREQIISRFRLSPAQPTALGYLREHVAQHSVREVAGGWDWKFDRRLPTKITEPEGQEVLARIRAPVDVIYGEFSVVVNEVRAQRIVAALAQGGGPICIPEGHHHILLTQPLLLIETLQSLLASRKIGTHEKTPA